VIEVFNRYEKKFLLDAETYQNIGNKLMEYMEYDSHNSNQEFYTISNIYFDTHDSQLIRNSLAKPKYKEKLRLRAYGIPKKDGMAFLEIKKKVCGLVNKRRTVLTLEEAYRFVNTGIKPGQKEYMNTQVMNEIDYLLKLYKLEPKLYLAYDRIALFGKKDRGLRITFDTDIRSRSYDLRLEYGDYGEKLLQKDQYLMEVKAENSIPVWLAKLLSEYKLYSTSFSKYGRVHEKALKEEFNLKGESDSCLKQYSAQQMPA